MSITKRAVAAMASAVLLWGGSLASGATVQANFLGANPGAQTFNVTYLKANNTSTTTSGIRAGQMDWKQISNVGGGIVANNQFFSTYCIDIAETVNDNTFEITTDPSLVPNPTQAAGSLATDAAGYAGKKKFQALSQLFAKHFSATSSSGIFHAAFQLAIWEIGFETSAVAPSLTTGTLKVVGSGGSTSEANQAIAMAEGFLSSLYVGPLYGNADFVYLRAPGNGVTPSNQDQIYYSPPAGGPPVIPLPLASVGGMALIGMLAAKRSLR